eukprot:6180124-Pleurochrysis_carterae.AAC.2
MWCPLALNLSPHDAFRTLFQQQPSSSCTIISSNVFNASQQPNQMSLASSAPVFCTDKEPLKGKTRTYLLAHGAETTRCPGPRKTCVRARPSVLACRAGACAARSGASWRRRRRGWRRLREASPRAVRRRAPGSATAQAARRRRCRRQPGGEHQHARVCASTDQYALFYVH